MLRRTLDDSYPAAVRRDVTDVTVARLTANAAYRFAPPFLATIARGLDVELSELGVALAVSELCGLSSPLIGRLVERVPRRWSMVTGLTGIGVGAVIAGASSGVVMFGAGLFVLAITKIVFDVGSVRGSPTTCPTSGGGAWSGVTETSWALGLLVGVSLHGPDHGGHVVALGLRRRGRRRRRDGRRARRAHRLRRAATRSPPSGGRSVRAPASACPAGSP